MVVWYDRATKFVYGLGAVTVTIVRGLPAIESATWDFDTQDFIVGWNGTIEGNGPWWLWSDGNLHATPEEV